MSLIGFADLDRPVALAPGRLYHAFGGGTFRLEPSRCAVPEAADGSVDFRLEIVRALTERDSHAMLSLMLAPEFPTTAALARVREIDPAATLAPCVLTDWWFRIADSPAVRLPPELSGPLLLASNGLGSARLVARLSIESGMMLEALLQERGTLAATAQARFDGVSPRVPVVVRFDPAVLLRELWARADAAGELPRAALVSYFAREPVELPVAIDGTLMRDDTMRFAEAMADRAIARFGQYVAAKSAEGAGLVRLAVPPAGGSIAWALIQPVLAQRQIVLPVDLLSAAQAQAAARGLDSLVERRTLASLPPLGRARVSVLCNLPAYRAGVEALGVTLTFPPRLPERPQARTATAIFEAPDDMATIDVALAPGEPLRYAYSTFAVISDDAGTRQLEAREAQGSESPLRLSAEEFPVELGVVEVTPALGELAIVSGTCTYEVDGRGYSRGFTLDSGQSTVGLALPRERTATRIECVAVARDGSGELRAGPFESAQVRLDVSSFAAYGPRQAQVRCVFDDAATLRAVSLLPDGLEDVDANITSLSFTPAEPVRTFRWFAASPFRAGFRYRSHDATDGAWSASPRGEPLVVHSSRLRATERRRESAAVMEAAAVEAIATSPVAQPTDEVLYTRIADATKKLYVPRYALDVQAVSGQQRYRVAMTQGEAASSLQVMLVATPAPALGDAAREATEYPHVASVHLEYRVAPPAGALKTVEFTDVTRAGPILTATLTFATLQERDDVYRAVTEPERHARLVVRRSIDVSVPQPSSGSAPGALTLTLLPLRPLAAFVTPVALAPAPVLVASPILATAIAAKSMRRESSVAMAATAVLAEPVARVRRPVDHFVKSLPVPALAFAGQAQEAGGTRLRFAIGNWADYSDDFFARANPVKDAKAAGRTKPTSRTFVEFFDAEANTRLYAFATIASAKQLADLAFTLPAGRAAPRQVSVTLTDRGTGVARRSNVVSTAVPVADATVHRTVRSVLEQAVAPEPFAFPPALHGYMFQGITPASGAGGFVRHRVAWRGTFHTYLQDASRPSVVYCFPDKFKIARRPDAPFTPFITVRVTTRPDGAQSDVVFDYVVAPYTDARRLADARAQLLAEPRLGAATVQFQPFASSDVRYFLDRPTAAGAVREQRTDAALVLQGALKDTLAMPLADFRLLFDAMQRRTASMFVGRVEIDVPGGGTEVVPFEARLDDLAGEMFSYTAATAADGTVQVSVRNEIESPVDVHTLDATLLVAGAGVPAVPTGAGLPREGLAPGQSLALTLAPAGALAAGSTPEVSFDLSGVTVKLDPEAAWDTILDRSATEFFRIVTVKAVAALFQPVAGSEDAKIDTILVEFESGGTAELDQATTSAQVRIDYPVDDVILGRPIDSAYRYTVTVIRANGEQQRDPQPREQTAGLFYVSVVR